MVRALDLRLRGRRFDSRPFHFHVTTLGKLFTHTRLCHQAVQFGTGQGTTMPCGWEGNRTSGVAMAMRHRLQWFIHLRAHGLRKGDEHPAYTRREVWPNLYSIHSSLTKTYKLRKSYVIQNILKMSGFVSQFDLRVILLCIA